MPSGHVTRRNSAAFFPVVPLKLARAPSRRVSNFFLTGAEKTFRSVRSAAADNPGVHFIAVSHSDRPSTDKWLESVGGSGDVSILVDPDRAIYAKWGLGASSLAHFLSPWAMWNVIKLGREEGIWNRPTESGSRWQQSGTWAVDSAGTIKWGGPSSRADDLPDVPGAINAVSGT